MEKKRVNFALDPDAYALLKQHVVSDRKLGHAVSAAIFRYYQTPTAAREPGVLERIEGLLEELVTLVDSRLPAK